MKRNILYCLLGLYSFFINGQDANTVYDDKWWSKRDSAIAAYNCPDTNSTDLYTNGIKYVDPDQATNGDGSYGNPYNDLPKPLVHKTAYVIKRGTTVSVGYRKQYLSSDSILVGAYGIGDRPIIDATDFIIIGNAVVLRDLQCTGNLANGAWPYSERTNSWLYNNESYSMGFFGSYSYCIGNDIHGSDQDGLWSSGTRYGHYNLNNDIGWNYIYDINTDWYEGADMGVAYGDGIQGTYCDTVWIHDNLIDRSTTGNKFCAIIGCDDGTELILYMYNNIFYAPKYSEYGGASIYLTTTTKGRLYNNIFYNVNGDVGLLGVSGTNDLYFYGNLMIGTDKSFSSGTVAFNNTFIDVGSTNQSYSEYFENNIISGSGSDFSYNIYTNNHDGDDSVFVNPGAGNYRLRNRAYTVDVGVYNDAYMAPYLYDLDSISVPHTSSIDLGSYQYNADINYCDTVKYTKSAIVTNETDGNEDGAIDYSISGGSGNYSYSWSNGVVTQDISGIPAGTYVVTVTDIDSGCTTISSYTLQNIITNTYCETNPITLDSTVLNYNANYPATGSVNITVSGGTEWSGYTYSWTGLNGLYTSTEEDIDSLQPGIYYLTITSDSGCELNQIYNIEDVTNYSSGITKVDSIQINIATTSHTATDWENFAYPFASNPISTTKYTADFICNTTSLNGYSVGISISEYPDEVGTTFLTPASHVDGDYIGVRISGITTGNKVNIELYASTNGSDKSCIVYIDSVEKTTFDLAYNSTIYYYDSLSVTNNDILIYIVENNASYNVNLNAIRLIEYSESTSPCDTTHLNIVFSSIPDTNTQRKAIIGASVTGGVGIYNYLWSTGSTNDTLFNAQGETTYNLIVTDTNDCYVSNDFTPDNIYTCDSLGIEVTLDSIHKELDNGIDGAVYITATGAKSPYEYLWSNGDTTPDLENVSSGIYSVNINSNDNCFFTNYYTIMDSITVVNQDSLLVDSILINFTDSSHQVNGWTNIYPGHISFTENDLTFLYAGNINPYNYGYIPIDNYPDSVAQWYVHSGIVTGGTLSLTINGLDYTKVYFVEVLANRDGSSERDIIISCDGESVLLDVMDETNNIAYFNNIRQVNSLTITSTEYNISDYTYLTAIKIYVYDVKSKYYYITRDGRPAYINSTYKPSFKSQ